MQKPESEFIASAKRGAIKTPNTRGFQLSNGQVHSQLLDKAQKKRRTFSRQDAE